MINGKHGKHRFDIGSTKLQHKALKVHAKLGLHPKPSKGPPHSPNSNEHMATEASDTASKLLHKEAKRKKHVQQQEQEQPAGKHKAVDKAARREETLAAKMAQKAPKLKQQQQQGVPSKHGNHADAGDAAAKAARRAVKQANKEAQQRQQKEQERQAKVLRLVKKIAKAREPDKKAKLQQLLQRALHKAGKQAQAEDGDEPSPPPAAAPPAAASRPQFSFTRKATPSSSTFITAAARQPPTADEQARRALRQRRFAADVAAVAAAGDGNSGKGVRLVEAVQQGQYGTLEALEKEYLRLTAMPLASDVRPPEVLRQALALVKARWARQPDYQYAWKQLKSIRQDLTVQNVAGALAVDVYETHGRIALEVDDGAEFRQCLSVLRRLYEDGAPAANAAEFAAYGVLFAAHHGSMLLASELAKVPERLLRSGSVAFALEACTARRLGDYVGFVRLYARAPFMCAYLLDALLPGVQQHGLAAMVTAHSPLQVPLELVATMLGFETAEEAAAFAEVQGAVVDAAAGMLDTKLSRAQAAGPARPLPAATP